MTIKRKILLLLLNSLFLLSCTDKVVYSDFTNIDPVGWDKDEPILFSFPIPDTINSYDILFHLRHQDNYPYQNMWLFVTTKEASFAAQTDTIEIFLADERGRWLGDGRNGHIRMPVQYEHNYHFTDTGTYMISVRQGMRSEQLRGVTQLGVELTRTDK